MEKVKVGVIGTGNIGSDLMIKIGRSEVLELSAVMGIDPNSRGMRYAKELGVTVFDNSMEGFKNNPELADILFDATSAKAHYQNAKIAKELGKQIIDLTPAAIGPFICPPVNLGEHLDADNVNLITCGGQATVPIVAAINQVAQVEYAEIVGTVASKSAGPGTRANIDEFTQTTAKALEVIGGAKKGKAIIILNPAEPPINMRNTIYCQVDEKNFDVQAIRDSITKMVKVIQEYVPGYSLRTEPIFDGNVVTVFTEVIGRGDYLPTYAGNLDIITAAAVKTAEEIAKKRLKVNA